MIYVGTCGYAYDDWLGGFYPATTRKSEMLSYYAGCFRAVEIDASFYGVLASATLARMDRATPPDFRFCFKAPRSLSHESERSASRVSTDAQAFVESVGPIARAGKLGCVLLQFPGSFRHSDSAVNYVRAVASSLQPLPLVVEFRNRAWQTPETHRLLCELDVGWCNVDMPEHKTLLHPGSDVTCGVGYVRFHGRNAANWWTGTNTTRYDYLYSAQELVPWTDRVAEIEDSAQTTFAFFNNHARGNAAHNAQAFVEMLRERYGASADEVVPARSQPPAQPSLFRE